MAVVIRRRRSRSLSPPERTAARAARTRTFEAILHDQNRFSYFLDYLSVHGQAHKLLFWFEIEQYKLLAGDDREMASHQETIFGKYFGAESGSGGGASGLELPSYASEHTEALYARAKGRPLGYMFDVAQAFVYQELRDRWLPRFRSSASHTAMVDHLRVSYPVSLPQLLAEGPFNHCLNTFVYDSGECPEDLRVNFQVWFAIHSSLRPLCASVLRSLELRGLAVAAKDLARLEDKATRFRDNYLDGANAVSSILRDKAKVSIVRRLKGLLNCKPNARGGIGSISSTGAATVKTGASYVESLKVAVTALREALAVGEEQAYHPLEETLVPALTKSKTFGNFVDDLSALECAPLQARLRLLNDWADVQRKLPEKAVQSSAGGKMAHLLRPCPTPKAPDIWPVASSKAGGVFAGSGLDGRDGRGRAVRAGGGADVTCPSLLFVFQVETEETNDLVDVEDGAGGAGGGLFGQAPRGLHGCAAFVSSGKSMHMSRRSSVQGLTLAEGARRRESTRSPPRARGVAGVSPAPRPSGGKMLRRFRTKVKQMRHVIAARVMQEKQNRTSGRGEGGGGSGGGRCTMAEELDVLAGMASDDTDYRNVRSRLNGQILELIGADVTEWLPRYCLPSIIARVEHADKGTSGKRTDGSRSKSDALRPPHPIAAVAGTDKSDGLDAAPPTVHHFVMTVPRRRGSPPSSPTGGSPSGKSPPRPGGARREGGGSTGGGGRAELAKRESARRWSTARPAKGSFPIAVDRENNLVLHAACATVWKKVETRGHRGGDVNASAAGGAGRGGSSRPPETTAAYVPQCVCALSFDPLFDTLRAVALARGGFPEAGRALMLTSGSGGSGGGKGLRRAANDTAMAADWGLGDAATLQVALPPLPIFPPPLAPPAPTLPTLFGPSTKPSTAALPPPPRPPLLQSVSAPESSGGWSMLHEDTVGGAAASVGTVGGGKWSHFGLPPLVPLDHPVEPLYQALSSDNVLLALSALLCERPVVVTCSVRSLLSVSVSSLKALLHPLGWHHPYAPLLPATEIIAFWRSKIALDRRNALSQGRSGSPPRIGPPQWGPMKAGAATSGPSSPEDSGAMPRGRPQTPFLVGIDDALVRMARCDTSEGSSARGSGGGHDGAGGKGGEVWGVVSTDSCMVSTGAEVDAAGVATTQPSATLLEVVRRMLTQSVHVDLDHDEVSWPPPAPPINSPDTVAESNSSTPDDGASSGGARGGKMGGGAVRRIDSLGFGGEGRDEERDEAGDGSDGGLGNGAPPAWPTEAARHARKVVQTTLFPDFESFDVVTSNPPSSEGEATDTVSDTRSSRCSASIGENAEAALRDKIEAFRSSKMAQGGDDRRAGHWGRYGASGIAGGVADGRRSPTGGMTESVVGMYVPTPEDLALRAAAAGLVASVLGRVKEFTTLFAQAGLMRFDTAGFVTAVARDGRNASLANKRHVRPSPVFGGSAQPDRGATRSGPMAHGAASSPATLGGGDRDDDAGPVVVASAGDDGSSAEAFVSDGKLLLDEPGAEMCLELVRTRAFAALLSDEVFADVDLEAMQAELRLHSAQIRDSLPAEQ